MVATPKPEELTPAKPKLTLEQKAGLPPLSPKSSADPVKATTWRGVSQLVTVAKGEGGPYKWQIMKEKGGITLETCEIKGSSSLGVKVTAVVQFSPVACYECMMDRRTKLADSEYSILEELEGGFRITYTRLPIPLFSDSDFCCGEWSGEHPSGAMVTSLWPRLCAT